MTEPHDKIHPRPNSWSTSLTKREWFAGMALQGLMASLVSATPDKFASMSVEVADALIKALNNE